MPTQTLGITGFALQQSADSLGLLTLQTHEKRQQGRQGRRQKGVLTMASKKGLYANIHAKRERIASGSGEQMRKPGSKGAPSAKDFKDSAKTAKKK